MGQVLQKALLVMPNYCLTVAVRCLKFHFDLSCFNDTLGVPEPDFCAMLLDVCSPGLLGPFELSIKVRSDHWMQVMACSPSLSPPSLWSKHQE